MKCEYKSARSKNVMGRRMGRHLTISQRVSPPFTVGALPPLPFRCCRHSRSARCPYPGAMTSCSAPGGGSGRTHCRGRQHTRVGYQATGDGPDKICQVSGDMVGSTSCCRQYIIIRHAGSQGKTFSQLHQIIPTPLPMTPKLTC